MTGAAERLTPGWNEKKGGRPGAPALRMLTNPLQGMD
jgi:hypothetical protein